MKKHREKLDKHSSIRQSNESFYGFILRRYECDLDLMNYAEIESQICSSIDEILDDAITYLKEYLVNIGERALPQRSWNSIRRKMEKTANSTGWVIKPHTYSEFENRTLPISLCIDQIRISDQLIQSIQNALA